MSQQLVQAPRLWPSNPEKDRRVTWTELFFDVIFVAAVAQVGTPLGHDYSVPGLLRYALLFVLIWWAWSGHTLYCTRFDTDDSIQRLLVLVQSFIAAVMAANAKDALDSTSSAGFAAAYAGMRIILVVQYLRARRVSETRALTSRYALGFGFAAAIWLLSALTDPPLRYWLWTAALLIDFATPWLAVNHSVKFPPDAVHFPERFGLFTLILLGEFVACVMRGIESQETWSPALASTAFASMAFAFAVRWWYFDGAQSSAERHVKSRRQARLFRLWNYAHFPLSLGIGIAGVGFERAIALQPGQNLNPTETWILCSAVALLMLALIAITATSEAAQKRPVLWKYLLPHVVLVGPVLAMAVCSTRLKPVQLVVGLFVICVGQVVLAQLEMFVPRRMSTRARRLLLRST
ncbi:MAG: low temperature requirement protein A [Bryobacteraceae bacterium]